MTNFSPREIVSELDRYIVGQNDAKRAVAIALRNRWRRQQLTGDLREEVLPKNILMIGPTGVGKTEISRRLARLAGAPFLKVEATKFTEVGYVGRDVDSIIRDLVEVGMTLVKDVKRREVRAKAEKNAEERVLDALVGPGSSPATRDSFRRRLRAGELNGKEIEIEVQQTGGGMPMFEIPGMPGAQMGAISIGDIFGKLGGSRSKTRREISVLPTPVGPIIRMFLGRTSSRIFSSSCNRRQRLRSATATARLASAWPMMKRSSSETISRGEKSVTFWAHTLQRWGGRPHPDAFDGIHKHENVQEQIVRDQANKV